MHMYILKLARIRGEPPLLQLHWLDEPGGDEFLRARRSLLFQLQK